MRATTRSTEKPTDVGVTGGDPRRRGRGPRRERVVADIEGKYRTTVVNDRDLKTSSADRRGRDGKIMLDICGVGGGGDAEWVFRGSLSYSLSLSSRRRAGIALWGLGLCVF